MIQVKRLLSGISLCLLIAGNGSYAHAGTSNSKSTTTAIAAKTSANSKSTITAIAAKTPANSKPNITAIAAKTPAVSSTKPISSGKIETEAEAELNQGKALFAKNKYSEAIPHFDKALSCDHKLKAAYLLRGESKERLKKVEAAIDDYNEYAELAPNDPDIFNRLSRTYQVTGKNNLALSYLSKLIVMNPRDGKLYARRCALYETLGQKELAKQDRYVAQQLGAPVPQPGAKKVASAAPNKNKVVHHHVSRSKQTTH